MIFSKSKEKIENEKNLYSLKQLQGKMSKFETERADVIELSKKFNEEVATIKFSNQLKEKEKEIEDEVNALSEDDVIARTTKILTDYFLGQRQIYWHIQNPFDNHDVFRRENSEFQEAGIQKIILVCFAALSDSMHNMPSHIERKQIRRLRGNLIEFYQDKYLILQFIEHHLQSRLPHTVYQDLMRLFPSGN